MKKNKPFILLKVINNKGRVVKMIATHKIKRVYFFLKAENFEDCMFKLCVRYKNDCKNEGEYQTKKDLVLALKVFMDVD